MIDIVWRDMKQSALDEISLIVLRPGEIRELTTQEIFTKRTTACRIVYDRLTLKQKNDIQDKAAKAGNDPNPPEKQFR